MSLTVKHLDHDGSEISSQAWRLMYCTSGRRLVKALREAGLPVGGSNEVKARRLLAAGIQEV